MNRYWPSKPLAEVAKYSLGKMLHKTKNKGELRDYLRNVNVRWFSFDLTDLQQMRFTNDETEKYTAVEGDVLICEGGYPGRAAIWNENYPIHFQKAIHRVRFYEPGRNRWFLYYLHSLALSGELKKHFTGTGIQHFTGEALARLPVPLPPLEVQDELTAALDDAFAATTRLESVYQTKIANLFELKQSILRKAFAGELIGPSTSSVQGKAESRERRAEGSSTGSGRCQREGKGTGGASGTRKVQAGGKGKTAGAVA